MPANLFLKHLMVLSDFGGEALGKITPFDRYFPDGIMDYLWNGREYRYEYQAFIGNHRANNHTLFVDGKGLLDKRSLNSKIEDIVMFILYAATSKDDNLTEDIKRKCMIGDYIGKPDELSKFVKQNYIRVSRQILGATNNSLGQLTQDYVIDSLQKELFKFNWEIKRNGSIPGISFNLGRSETVFDIVVKSPNGVYFAIEISFQFTGNSVIERKAHDAKAMQERLHQEGHYICYVIDGAGNIDTRRPAVSAICDFSDCTVAFTSNEMIFLASSLLELAHATENK